MSLNQYMIMASCDTAYDGSMVTTTQLLSVIQTGCRFYDFQVFYDDTESYGMARPYIGYSTPDPTFVSIQGVNTDSTKRLTLVQVLTTIASNCFNPFAPNFYDPVFIHLRIKSMNENIYDQVAQNIHDTITSRLFLDQTGRAIPVHKETLLRELMGKIIIVVNRTLNPHYLQTTACEPALSANNLAPPCIYLGLYVNIESGGTNWRAIAFQPQKNAQCAVQGGTASPIVDESTQSMGIIMANNSSIELFMVLPNYTFNPDILSISTYVSQYACQTLMVRFYLTDGGLSWYKGLFSVYKTAFLPMGYAINAIASPEINTAVIM